MANDALTQYQELGYNTDYSNGYNPTTAPDTSVNAWYQSQGKKPKDHVTIWNGAQYDTWKETMANRYDEYLKWYDTNYQSEAEKLARSTAIGQNPYYSDVLGSSHIDGSPIRAEKSSQIDPLAIAGQSLDMLGGISDRIQSILNGDSQRALQDSQAYLNEQKATGQYLDNIMQQIGMGDSGGFAQVSRLKEYGIPVSFFGMPQRGNNGQSIFDTSFFGQNREFTNAFLRANGGIKAYQKNVLLPLEAAILRGRAAFEGMSEEEYKRNMEDFRKSYQQYKQGQYEFNIKSIMEEWDHVGEEGGPTIGQMLAKSLFFAGSSGLGNLFHVK